MNQELERLKTKLEKEEEKNKAMKNIIIGLVCTLILIGILLILGLAGSQELKDKEMMRGTFEKANDVQMLKN